MSKCNNCIHRYVCNLKCAYEDNDRECLDFDEERPQGEWEVYGKQGDIPITDMCSNCRYEMKWYKDKYNFCPNCGAKMKGGAE